MNNMEDNMWEEGRESMFGKIMDYISRFILGVAIMFGGLVEFICYKNTLEPRYFTNGIYSILMALVMIIFGWVMLDVNSSDRAKAELISLKVKLIGAVIIIASFLPDVLVAKLVTGEKFSFEAPNLVVAMCGIIFMVLSVIFKLYQPKDDSIF